jgi:hypothetical protein
MIKILASYNKKLDKIFMKKCLSKCKKYFFNYSKRNFTVSKKIEILHVFARMIQNEIREDINNEKF